MTAFEAVTSALTEHGRRVQMRGEGQASAQCPAHDDRTASLSLTRSAAGVLLNCHTGCSVDDVLGALQLQRRDLFDEALSRRQGYEVTAEYPYVDEAGQVLYVKQRRWPKDFRQYVPQPDGSRRWQLGDVRRVLYRLPDVLAAVEAGEPVYVTEGEKDADALAAAGVVATTWSDGAWKAGARPKWRPDYTATLTGADVVLVRDRDEPGEATAADIAHELAAAAKSVHVVEAKAGKDAADHLAAGHAVDDLTPVEAAAEPEPAGEDGGRGPSQATILRRLALSRYSFGVAADGAAYAVPASGPRIARPFRGGRSGLRAELAKLYAEAYGGTVPSASALADALTALEGEAHQADPQPLHVRVARHEHALYLDLGRTDGEVVRVSSAGWDVLTEAPVLFRRTQLTSPLPTPERPGDFGPLRSRLNVDEADWPLVVAWLVAALIPTIPHPVLSLIGEQGTGKSTATALLVGVLDPSPAPTRSAPRDVEQWAVQASASWLVGLDNLSGVPAWLSDTLCRAVTGDGIVRRRLYADDDVSVLAFRRVIVSNGIDYGAVRGDLADRMMTVELHRIDPSQRRTASAVEMHEGARAAVLGALLELAVQVLGVLPDIRLEEMPRMADFARVLAAVDRVMGTTGLDRYAAQAADLAGAVVEADPFAGAVVELLESRPSRSWEGTGGALLEVLTEPDPRPKSWPADGQRANAALRRVAPALREVAGLTIEDHKHPRTRKVLWSLAIQPEEARNEPSQPSQPSHRPLTSDDAAKADPASGFAGPS